MSRSWLRGIAFGLVVVLALVPLSAVAAPGAGDRSPTASGIWTRVSGLLAALWAEPGFAIVRLGQHSGFQRDLGRPDHVWDKDGILINPDGNKTPAAPPSQGDRPALHHRRSGSA